MDAAGRFPCQVVFVTVDSLDFFCLFSAKKRTTPVDDTYSDSHLLRAEVFDSFVLPTGI
ncbi:hypothetical protein ACFFQF_16500 [Haladaptatus pallidirubidus]|uniref:hypothetical protein n=1 Tax=Haladaptatus pallidirubidus TaxID=1008152 RepID=UPI001D1258B1|nr:hypothetical protein [Haladaptatus pallidirubidus]